MSENYTAAIPVAVALLGDADPIEFITELMRLFRDHAKQQGYELVSDYVRIVVMDPERESFDEFLSGMRMVSVTASCREVGT